MTAIFADTFYWTALTSSVDRFHTLAVDFSFSMQPEKLVTTDEVLVEYLAFFSSARPGVRVKAGKVVANLLKSSTVLVLPQCRESFLSGLKHYCARPDKGYSLTDCISMQTMRKQGLTDVLTNDKHFEQEGFHPLFRDC